MKYPKLFFILLILSSFSFACTDDDGSEPGGGELPQVNVNSVSKFEGNENSNFEFLVRLSAASEQTVTVEYDTKDGSAVAGEDFEATSGTLTFAPGSTSETISVTILADTLREGDEEFEFRIFDPSNAVVLGGVATATIRNDDTFLPNSNDGYSTPDSYAGYDLVWSDEFEGNALDLGTWTRELGNHGWGNNELQNYTNSDENSFVSNGNLIIEAREEPSGGSNYSSARLISSGNADFQYGRIDIRAKLPKGQGVWPALWMLGSNFWDISWPHCGEIDIMEIVGHEPDKLHGTIHWEGAGGYASFGGNTRLDEGDFSDKYHVFTIIWDDAKIRWFLDDELYHQVDITPAHMTEFHANFFFIMNIAVGGNWPGSPDATTVFPQRMYVDYIRVFQED